MPPLPAWQAYMPRKDLMSWTRLDDDRTNHIATSWRLKAWCGVSADLVAQGQLLVWRKQGELDFVVRCKEHALGHNSSDRFRLEVDYGDNELTHQLVLRIEVLDPCDALLGASVPEIYYQLVHRIARCWDVFYGDDASYPHLDLAELVDGDDQTR